MNEPDLFGWAGETGNAEKLLREGEPIFPPVPEVTSVVTVAVEAALATPPPFQESPLAGPDDPVVIFQTELIAGYEGDGGSDLASIARDIVVHKEYLVIAGLRVKRENEKMDDTNRNSARDIGGTAGFLFAVARDQYWQSLPTEQEFRRIVDAIPGKDKDEKKVNLFRFLQLPFSSDKTRILSLWLQHLSPAERKRKKMPFRAEVTTDKYGPICTFKPPGDINKYYHCIRCIVR